MDTLIGERIQERWRTFVFDASSKSVPKALPTPPTYSDMKSRVGFIFFSYSGEVGRVDKLGDFE
jgi:hypothetical protein